MLIHIHSLGRPVCLHFCSTLYETKTSNYSFAVILCWYYWHVYGKKEGQIIFISFSVLFYSETNPNLMVHCGKCIKEGPKAHGHYIVKSILFYSCGVPIHNQWRFFSCDWEKKLFFLFVNCCCTISLKMNLPSSAVIVSTELCTCRMSVWSC
jgi:hypothetical protein